MKLKTAANPIGKKLIDFFNKQRKEYPLIIEATAVKIGIPYPTILTIIRRERVSRLNRLVLAQHGLITPADDKAYIKYCEEKGFSIL